jgi:hypothetical protein
MPTYLSKEERPRSQTKRACFVCISLRIWWLITGSGFMQVSRHYKDEEAAELSKCISSKFPNLKERRSKYTLILLLHDANHRIWSRWDGTEPARILPRSSLASPSNQALLRLPVTSGILCKYFFLSFKVLHATSHPETIQHSRWFKSSFIISLAKVHLNPSGLYKSIARNVKVGT